MLACSGFLRVTRTLLFFQNVACTRKHKSKISKIAGLSGNSFESSEGICDCFLNLYSSLCSSKSSKPIDRIFHALSRDLPSLNSLDLEAMIKPVTKLRWDLQCPLSYAEINLLVLMETLLIFIYFIGILSVIISLELFLTFLLTLSSWILGAEHRWLLFLKLKIPNELISFVLFPCATFLIKLFLKFFASRLKFVIHNLVSQ